MKLKKLATIVPSIILSLAGLLCINPQAAFAAGPFTCTWTGGGGSDVNFSTAANWGGCNGAAPVVGNQDNLIFPAGAASTNPNNDRVGTTTFSSIVFTGEGYTLTGNSIAVNGPLTSTTGATGNHIDAPITANNGSVISNTVTGAGFLGIGSVTIGVGSTISLDTVVIGSLSSASGNTANIGPDVTITTASNVSLDIDNDFTVGGTYSATSATVNDGATLTVSGSMGSVTVNSGGTLIANGTTGGATVHSGGLVLGTGTMSGVTSIEQGATLAPGHSPGCLTLATVGISGTYEQEIGGTTACTDYDKLNVTNTVNITNGTLDTKLVNGFAPTIGETYTIIDNQGISPVFGTFNGLAEGATFTADGYNFRISYIGGTGNDVVLTALGPTPAAPAPAAPAAPNTGFGSALTNPAAVLISSTVAALMIIIITRRLRPVKV